MGWEEFKQDLQEKGILWELPKPDDLEMKTPTKGIKMIDRQSNSGTKREIRRHWMNFCSDDVIEAYSPQLIADQVGLLAQRETGDFDDIIEEYSDGKGDRINLRQYISLLAFHEEDLLRPWEREEEQ